MSTSTSNHQADSRCKVFQELNLSAAQLRALRKQGFVRGISKGRQGVTFKLCFRMEGRQVSVNIGRSHERAAAVQQALETHQAPRGLRACFESRRRELRRIVTSLRPHLDAELAALGLRRHGLTVRRIRNPLELQQE